jgi:hypothetical protein
MASVAAGDAADAAAVEVGGGRDGVAGRGVRGERVARGAGADAIGGLAGCDADAGADPVDALDAR